MNLILLDPDEALRPLPKRDERREHLVKVLHKGPGDRFDAGILGGKLGTGTIEEILPDGSLRFSLSLDRESPSRAPIRLAVGFPRPIQLRRLLRDLSNLGLSAIDLVGTELGEKSYRDTKLLEDGGARSALIEGAIQSRETTLPVLTAWDSLDAWLEAAPWRAGGEPLYLIAPDNVRPALSLSDLPAIPAGSPEAAGSAVAGSREAVLAVGSERGWSDRERELLGSRGFLRASMGGRALRTETACVVSSALLLERLGLLR